MIQGKSLKICYNGAVVALSKSCSIDIDADTLETSRPGDGKARTYIVGRTSWKADCTWLVATSGSLKSNILKVGSMATLVFQLNGNIFLSGEAILNKCKITAQKGNILQGSFSWQGTGPLA